MCRVCICPFKFLKNDNKGTNAILNITYDTRASKKALNGTCKQGYLGDQEGQVGKEFRKILGWGSFNLI